MARQTAFEILEKITSKYINDKILTHGETDRTDLTSWSDEVNMYHLTVMDKRARPTDDLGKRLKDEMRARNGKLTKQEEENAREYFLLDFDKATRWAGRLIRNYHPECPEGGENLGRATMLIIRAQDDLDMLKEVSSPATYSAFSEEGNPLPELKAKLHYASNYISAHDKLRFLSGKIFDAVEREDYEEAARRRTQADAIISGQVCRISFS